VIEAHLFQEARIQSAQRTCDCVISDSDYSAAMSFEQIKEESATLTPEQRRQLIGHLLALGRKDDGDFRRKLAAKLDDNDPSHWVSEDDLDRALGLDAKDS
jgi:hypothetical protein